MGGTYSSSLVDDPTHARVVVGLASLKDEREREGRGEWKEGEKVGEKEILTINPPPHTSHTHPSSLCLAHEARLAVHLSQQPFLTDAFKGHGARGQSDHAASNQLARAGVCTHLKLNFIFSVCVCACVCACVCGINVHMHMHV